MKQSYSKVLSLPTGISFNVVWQDDSQVNQEAVNDFVNSIARPTWYASPGDSRNDVKEYMLAPGKDVGLFDSSYVLQTDPFTKRDDMRLWQCSQCKCATTYAGVEIGHKNKWRDELKTAGVLSAEEARAAYNNLRNLRIECATCNHSHDWE